MDNSPFSKLPAELRNVIYELVLQPPGGLGCYLICDTYKLHAKDGTPATALTKSPGLTAVCKKIREEARPLFLTQNRLTIPVDMPFHSVRHAHQPEYPKFLFPDSLHPLDSTIHVRTKIDLTETAFRLRESREQLDSFWPNVGGLATPVIQRFRASKVMIELDIQIHRFGHAFRTPAYRTFVCKQDVPLSEYQAGRMTFSFEPATVRQEDIDEAFEAKRRQLVAHSDHAVHRICSIRAERVNLLRQLEDKKAVVEMIVGRMPGDIFELGIDEG